MEVGDHSLHVLRPLPLSTLGGYEILDAELDLLWVIASLAEGDDPAEVVGLGSVVVCGTVRGIASPLKFRISLRECFFSCLS